jgi:hypothetical protein
MNSMRLLVIVGSVTALLAAAAPAGATTNGAPARGRGIPNARGLYAGCFNTKTGELRLEHASRLPQE